jgi:hypothetical protein
MPTSPRSPGRAATPGDEPRTIRLWELLFRPRLFLLVLLIAAGMAVAPFVPVWWNRLRSQDEFRISPNDIRVNSPHAWVPEQLLQEVFAELPPSLSLLDDSLVTQVAAFFERNPWIESVAHVRMTRAGIDVEVVYRRPVLFVKTAIGVYPVDARGVLLPPTDFSLDDAGNLPVFVSGDATPTGGPGQTWNDPLVLSAVSLAECLVPQGDMTKYWDRFGLESLRVESDGDESTAAFILTTHGGSEIIWGRSPRQEFTPLEPTTEQKLSRLEQYSEQYGDFESPDGPYHIDIRHFEHITRKPLDQSIR